MKLIAPTAAAGGLDLQDEQGRSCLMLASSKGLTGVVDAMLGAGTKAELVDEQTRTSLMLAIDKGRAHTATVLIPATAAAGALDCQGTCALDVHGDWINVHGRRIKDNTGTTTRRQMVRD